MMEYIAYKKFKKNRDHKVQERADSRASVARTDGPVLTDDDERFFERLTSEDGYSDIDGNRPPLPPRVKTPDYSWDSETDSYVGPRKSEDGEAVKTKGKGKDSNESGLKRNGTINRLNLWIRRPKKDSLEPTNAEIPIAEEEREKDDLSRVLDDLNLAARNNKTFSISKDSQDLVGQFTMVLKDLVNGVPTAATDLKHLLDDHDGTLARNYEKLPGSMKKLVTNLPTKLTNSIAPELLSVAAASQGLEHDKAAGGGIKDQAMKLLIPKNMSELVTKPSAIVGMLKAIMNALKLRWPAFIGTNVIWSVALFCESHSVLWLSSFTVALDFTDGKNSAHVCALVLPQARSRCPPGEGEGRCCGRRRSRGGAVGRRFGHRICVYTTRPRITVTTSAHREHWC